MGWFTKDTPAKEEAPKKKMCCACPETKAPRDECIATHGPDDPRCIVLIEAHKACLRSEGFKSRQLCLLHTLNNLLQRRAFSHAELDAVAAQLPGGSCWFGNMHRTLWLGNYGVSVVELALAHHGKDLRWHDSRKGDLSFVNGERCWAVMLNVRSSGWFAALTGGRHWFGVKRFGDMWYNLDSHLAAPEPLLGADFAAPGNQPAADDHIEQSGAADGFGVGSSGTASEQLLHEQGPAVAACSMGAAGSVSVMGRRELAASAQSTVALLCFLRQALDQADALLFEVREHAA